MARDGFDREAPRDEWREARKKPVVVEFRGPYRDTETVETIEGDFEVDEEYVRTGEFMIGEADHEKL